ncbi:hypothetical protein L195_g059052 [Trifolium pratense]|uniref:Uncharacterized protein n=1 Tax=Trifolium pratense TaxID=57577 RepID=A0A2K3JVS9_TRIPR|nr:hypothetical protein L195_g059052 [Trifolium pratense]
MHKHHTVMVMKIENWTKGGVEGEAPLVAPPPVDLHLEEEFWIRWVGRRPLKFREKAEY